jgi:CHAT domain-containing protein
MDLYEFMKTCCQQRQQLQQQVYSPVGDGMDDENRHQRISSVHVPVHAVPLAAYYQTPHYVTAQSAQ